MSEFSIEFYFDLQRFASFTNGNMGTDDEPESGVLSYLFDQNGAAVNKKDMTTADKGNNLFWANSALVSLTPTGANSSVGSAISLVSGTYNTMTLGSGDNTRTGYVISALTGIDAQGLNGGSATFGTIGNVTILNPNGTLTIGSNTVTFNGGGLSNSETLKAFGDEWEVGTRVAVKNGEISNATMTGGEVVTTANGLSAAFTNGGIATFANKSFKTIDAFSDGSGASLAVSDSVEGATSFLRVSESANNVSSSLKSAVTATYDGTSLQSVTFGGSQNAVVADVTFGGKANIGRDVSIAGSAVNVSDIKSASSAILYQVHAQNTGYSFDPNILNVTDVDPSKSSKKITVSKLGGADFLIASDYFEDDEEEGTVKMTTINIAGVNYMFNDTGDQAGKGVGNGGVFEVTNGQVTGFVFRDKGDSITIPNGTDLSEFNLYTIESTTQSEAVDNDETQELLTGLKKLTIKLSGSDSDLVIEKTSEEGEADTFEIEVYDGASLQIENEETGDAVEMGFTLPKYQGNTGAAKITINADGQIQSIETVVKDSSGAVVEAAPQVGGTEVKISGATGDAVSSDLTVNSVTVNNIASGEFNYVVEGKKGQAGIKTIQLASADDTIGAITDSSAGEGADARVKVNPYAGGEGKVTFTTAENEEYEYTFTNANGNAFLYADADSLQFVFVDVGDAITISEEASAVTELNYLDKSTETYRTDPTNDDNVHTINQIPVVTGSDTYTVEMVTTTRNGHSKAEFALTGLAADSYVRYVTDPTAAASDEDPTFTYSAAGGTFLFGQNDTVPSADGFTAESGNVTMNEAAAAFLGTPDDSGKAVFEIDGTAVLIEAVVSEAENLVYSKDENGLLGLLGGSEIHTAGAITKIYAPTAEGEFTFNQLTPDDDSDDQVFSSMAMDGDVDDLSRRAYFTVDGTKATGFTFVVDGDQLTATDFSTLTLTDASSGNTFDAPVITENDEAAAATIVKANEEIAGVSKDCYQIIRDGGLQGLNVEFGDESSVTFDTVDETATVYFDTSGALLSVNGIYNANDRIIVENAQDEVNIDDNVVEITSGGFTYTMLDPNTPAIVDVKAGATVVQAAGVAQIRTIGGTSGIGDFTFGASAAAKTYSIAGDDAQVDGVIFKIDDNVAVTGVSGVDNTESITGAFGTAAGGEGVELNGEIVKVATADTANEYTFTGTSFIGLQDGDSVVAEGGVSDFITGANGTFNILGDSMAIAGDSQVVFSVTDGALTNIKELSGTAIGDFQEELGVNTETIAIVGDSSVAVSGDDSVVTAIANIGGGSIALEQIGSASQVVTDADGTFSFVEGQQTFTTGGTSDGVTFGIEDKKVTSITGVDDGELVRGDFSGDGISVDGSLVQVENNGDDITYVRGSHSGMSGTGIYGLYDGASVISASGIDVAVAVGQSGTYTFGENQTFTIANDSNNHVGFLLENGKVTGIFDVDGEVSGNLNGITINQKAPDIQVIGVNGENTNLTYSDGLLTGIVDGDTIISADNVSTVRTQGEGTFTFGSQSYYTTDEDGIDFVVKEGTTDVIGIDALASDATLTGALSGLSSINGQSVIVRNDPSYAVVGASTGIKEIFDVSGGAEVVYAGGASKVITDTEGAFTIGGKSFTTALDDEVEFELDPQGQATGISGLSGTATSDHENFEGGFTVNGLSFAITGDEDDLAVTGTQDAQGISAISKVGGALVNINDAAGATLITTDKEGSFTFTKGGQSFLTNDTELDFTLDETEKVTGIDLLDSNITGNFTEVDTVNDQTVRVTDSDNILTLTGRGGSAIAKISDVDGDGEEGATITNVGGASQVVTKTAGKFTFAGHNDPFETSGDDELTFDMVEGADAQVRGITGIDDGAVTGNLGDLEAINGQSFIVDNDDDNKFTYEKNGSVATVSGVAGDNVNIQALAGASTVELEKDGNYTFGDKTYTFGTGSAATVSVNGLTVTSIEGLDQDGEQVIGDFTSNIKLGDKNFNILGDSSVTVAQENGQLVISGLNDGAKIEAADSVLKATTEEAGTFSDTDDRTLTIGNGDALLSLDGAAHIIGVSGVTDGIGGDISGLPINGNSSSVVNVISAPDGQPSTNVSLNGDTLSGVVANDTIISAGPATLVVADGADGSYQFGIGSAAKRFDIIDDTNGVLEFAVGGTSNTVVSAVSDIDEGAILVGELNGVAVNGVNVSVTGDSDNIFGVIGDASGGISALINVGGGSNGVTVMSAGGADEVITSTEGKFTFNGSGQKFTVAGDSSVSFDIEGNAGQESVTAVKDLDGTVAGDFSNAIAVNDGTIQVTGDRDGVSVVGADDTVAAINDVDAGASVVSSGNASVVGVAGEGVYTFVESNEKFTIAGDTALNFNLDNGDVIGVDSFQRIGTDRALITFDPSTTPTLEINPTVNDPVAISAASGVLVTVEVDTEGKIVGVAGAEVIDGLENATVNATGPMVVNGKEVDVVDVDNSFNVEVENYEVKKVTAVTGNATVNVADVVVEANKDGEFQINGASYTVVDGDDTFALTTDPNKNLSAVSSLDGAIIVEDGTDELTINGNDIAVSNTGNAPVTVYSDGTNITAVEGLVDNATISGALDNASIAMASVAANDANNMSILTVNDTLFALVGPDASTAHDSGYHVADLDGVTINGKGEIVGLDDGARMIATEAGLYTVNGSVINAVPGDTIFGAGEEGAYIHDPDNILVRKSTPLSTIESITGITALNDSVIGSYVDPASKASLDSILADSAVDKDRVLEIYTTNDSVDAQDIDLSPYDFSKKVHLFNGEQNLAFNDQGGNFVHVEETYRAADGNDSLTSGKKNITLGDGGDVAVVDMARDIGNEVNIAGGAGDDSIFVRNNVDTTIVMSEGGADKVVTFAGANARVALEGYNASTGAGVQFDHLSLRDAEGGIANAIEKGVIGFGDGVVSLTTSAGNTQISLNGATGGTNSLGGSVVNLFTPEGTRQQVAFTHSAGGVASVATTSTEDVIFIGNKDGKKETGSTLVGGFGNDVAFAGEGDVVDLGDGINTVRLQDNDGREGAFVNISAGSNAIYGSNGTLDEIHGDTLGVDLTQMEFAYVDGNLIVHSKDNASLWASATVFSADQDGTLSYDTALAQSADLAESADDTSTTGGTSSTAVEDSLVAAAVVASLAPDHNYTNQLINSNGTLIKAAIGATGSVIDVKLDEDVRANYYVGDDSGLTFYGYNGDVLVDLEGDWQASRIDQQGIAVEGVTSIAAGTGLNYIKGSDNNETFFAGRGNSHLYGDGGRNLLVGYDGLDKEGQTTFYLLGNAYDAANTISGFEFVDDNNYTNNSKVTADKLEVDLPTNYVNRVALSNDDVVINVTGRNGINTESAVITGAKGKDILVSGDGIVADVVAQIGDDTLTFDKFANYYNATGKNATVVVDQNNQMDYARVWLDNASLTGTTFIGDIHEINASLYSGAAELAGNDYNNTIIAGSGTTSLWGGNRGDDALVAGTGQDTFYYTLGNGTDTIYGAKDGDVVNLAGVKLSDIVGAEFSEIGVALNFRDGGKLYIGDEGGNDVSYVVEGQTYFVNDNHNGFERKQ